MQRSALLRCIVSNCVVYAKKDSQPFGWLSFLAAVTDSNNLNATRVSVAAEGWTEANLD